MNKPYVISCELELVGNTVNQASLATFREGLDADLRAIGKETLWVETEQIKTGLDDLVADSELPVISLDGRYVANADAYLGISRSANPNLSDAGYDARLGFDEIPKQLDAIGWQFTGQEVVIADDVLFSGEMTTYLQKELAQRGVTLSALLCGIAIGEGTAKLAEQGITTKSIFYFEDVDDEICERDFTILAGSGRKIKNQQQSALYFDPEFGRPEQWASIPLEEVAGFCVRNLARNIGLVRLDQPAATFLGYPTSTNGEVIEYGLQKMERSDNA